MSIILAELSVKLPIILMMPGEAPGLVRPELETLAVIVSAPEREPALKFMVPPADRAPPFSTVLPAVWVKLLLNRRVPALALSVQLLVKLVAETCSVRPLA